MSESSENIEAKLCAYLDGELDVAGRAEIERHLEANPGHRKLLTELMQTKDLVRNLPRAEAPADLADTITGQLERAVLLDGAGVDEAGLDARLNRWPQVVSIAAVVLLAVGLGTIVYVALPGTGPRREPAVYTSAQQPKPAVSDDEADADPDAPLAAVSRAAATDEAVRRTENKLGTVEVAGATTGPTIAMGPPPAVPPSPSPAPAALPGVVGPATEPSESIVASAAPRQVDDPRDAASALARTPTTALAAADAAIDPFPDRLRDGDAVQPPVELAMSIPTVSLPADPVVLIVDADDPAGAYEEVSRYLTLNNLRIEPVANPTAAAATESGFARAGTQPSAPLAEARAEFDSTDVYGARDAARKDALAPLEAQAQEKTLQGTVEGLQGGQQLQQRANQRIYLARNVSRQQVAELQTALDNYAPAKRSGSSLYATPATSPVAEAFQYLNVAQAATAPAPQPAEPLVRPGDELTVTVEQLIGPGVDKTNRLRVSTDGTVTLPMLPDPVRAAGVSPAQLGSDVASRYREANLIPDATVIVTLDAPPPQAASADGEPSASPVTQPTTVPDATAGTGNVDLLLVLQATPTAAEPAPTTTPTDDAPTTEPAQ